MRRIDTMKELLGFLREHDKENTIMENDSGMLFDSGYGFSRTIARFSDGAALSVETDYEGDYSDATPGQGFTVVVRAYDPGEEVG